MTAKQLKDWREKSGFTRAELAARLGTSHRNVEAWEQERRAIPPIALTLLQDLMKQDVLKIPLTPELRSKLDKMAKERGLDPTIWAQEILSKILLIAAVAFLGHHLLRSPSDWSAASLMATGRAGLELVASLF